MTDRQSSERTEAGSAVLQVLYVEDDALVRELTQELLLREDREVCACASAEEALAHLHARIFDLLITDVSLPSMSGLALARHFLDRHPAAGVILASGYPQNLGLDRFGPRWRSIEKPIEADALDALIAELSPVRASG